MFTRAAHFKTWRCVGVAAVLLTGCVGQQRIERDRSASYDISPRYAEWHFDNDQRGRAPSGWRICETNPTESLATWEVAVDETAPSGRSVMALTKSENYDGTFNLAIAESILLRDLDLTVRVKAVKGEKDQGGGPIWRCKDENNYYTCRFNPLEGNYRVYAIKDGRRKQLDSAMIETVAGRWYTIRVRAVGDHITCRLDGEELLKVEDSTFAQRGMVGVWTKADAVTSFDDLAVRSLDED